MLLAGSANSDWYLGLTLGFIIVTVVVILVAIILSYAARIGDQTLVANEGLEEVRDGTAPLWEVRNTNAAGLAILGATRTAREAVVATVTGAPPPPAAAPAPEQGPAAGLGGEEAQAEGGPTEPPGVLGPDSYPSRGQGA
jgi:hypothetical protein